MEKWSERGYGVRRLAGPCRWKESGSVLNEMTDNREFSGQWHDLMVWAFSDFL